MILAEQGGGQWLMNDTSHSVLLNTNMNGNEQYFYVQIRFKKIEQEQMIYHRNSHFIKPQGVPFFAVPTDYISQQGPMNSLIFPKSMTRSVPQNKQSTKYFGSLNYCFVQTVIKGMLQLHSNIRLGYKGLPGTLTTTHSTIRPPVPIMFLASLYRPV
jgi:hypothetical protein